MECITAVTGKFAEFAVPPIARQFGYVLHYNENLKRMKTDVEDLEGMKENVQHKVDEARNNGEEIEDIVLKWMNKVENTVAEAKKLIDTEEHARAQCSMGHFPNLYTRHQLSKKIKKMILEISKVLFKGKFDRISYHVAFQATVTPSGEVMKPWSPEHQH